MTVLLRERAAYEEHDPVLDRTIWNRQVDPDLDAPAFVKLCLNRVRLFERGYRDDPERPVASASGWIDNPLELV